MLKNLLYAILLGIGMAACLSESSRDDKTDTNQVPEQLVTDPDQDAENKPSPEHFIIKKGSVGTLEIGMPVDDVLNKRIPGFAITDTILVQEGQEFTAYNMHLKEKSNTKGLLIEQQCNTGCQVWRINVKGSNFKTSKGIGVGSKYSEVQQFYPIETVVLADGGLVAVSQEAGMSFVLDSSQIPAKQRSNLSPATVPANTLVKSILIY
jgi:hypothetical protein